MITSFQSIDKHKSVLIIGIGNTNKHYMEVVKPESVLEAQEVFGFCPLTEAYGILVDGHEDEDIFLLNIENVHDYLEAANILRSYSFSYIVPVDVELRSSFTDPTSDTMRTYYVKNLMQKVCGNDDCIILATDRQAELYEDIDAFLDDMRDVEMGFKANASTSDRMENIVFVLNNLHGISCANAVLARMILNSDVDQYPFEDRKRKAVFDIDFTDRVLDMAYFRNHADGTTTVENLLNLMPGESPEKIFTVYRICAYIGKDLSFDDYIGSVYTMYRKQQIAQEVQSYLERIKGTIIRSFRIDSVYAKEDPYHPGTVKIVLKYSIQPVGCTERFIQRTVIA